MAPGYRDRTFVRGARRPWSALTHPTSRALQGLGGGCTLPNRDKIHHLLGIPVARVHHGLIRRESAREHHQSWRTRPIGDGRVQGDQDRRRRTTVVGSISDDALGVTMSAVSPELVISRA